MKLKELFFLLGLKPRPQTFGFAIETHELSGEGRIDIAQWQHQAAYRVAPSQAAVDQLRQLLHPGDVAIDIGAHTGDTTIPMALAVGPSGVVLALEPNRHVFEILAKNATLNRDKTNIVPLMFAAMRTDGVFEFQYGEAGYNNGGFHEGMSRWQHGSAYKLQVEGRNLQQLLERDYPDLIRRIRFVKVDAEGFDLAILETIDRLLRAQRPCLQVEMFDLKKSDPKERIRLYDFLIEHRYRVHRVEGDEMLLGEVVTPENLMHWRGYDVCCVPVA
jgi:FkbM family methyltransferase